MIGDAFRRLRRVGQQLKESPFPTLLLVLSIVFVAFLYPTVGGSGKGTEGGIAFPDVLIGAMIVSSMLHLSRGDWLARDAARAISVPVLVIGLGALIGSLHAGLQGWIVDFFIRDIAVILAFLSAIDILRRGGPRTTRLCFGALGICIILAAVQLGTSSGSELRASGTFPNPNIPGNLLAIAILCWTAAPFRWSTKSAVILIALTGLLKTASFGSILQLSVGFGYLAMCHVDAAKRLMRGRRLAMTIPILLLILGGGFAYTQLNAAQGKSGFNQARFDRSSGTRGLVWAQALSKYPNSPFGVGPGSVRGVKLNDYATELHSEPLAYLIERGPIGLFGLLLMWLAMVRYAPPGSAARAMVLAYIVGGFFRETAHYRHFWLLLPLALVVAEQSRRTRPVREVARVTRGSHDPIFDRSTPVALSALLRAIECRTSRTVPSLDGVNRSGTPIAARRMHLGDSIQGVVGAVFV